MAELSAQKHLRLSTIIHMLLWILLAFWVSEEILLPGVRIGSLYGISSTTSETGSSKKKLTINDFSSHFNFVKRAWLRQTAVSSVSSIYSLENHLKVTSDWAGIKLDNALPFGYSPTMLWVLGPLICFPHIIAWCIFNIFGLISIWWTTHPSRCRHGIGLLAFFSPLALGCFILGQTALVTGAALLYIAEKTGDENAAQGWRTSILTGIALWSLTAKPPIALTAGAVLIGLRQWRPLTVAVMLFVLSTLAITPLMGIDWLHDYLQIIGSYNRIDIGPAYAWSLHPSQMANLRGILNVDFGVADDFASLASNIVWFMLLFCIAAIGKELMKTKGLLWSVGIMSYLLFCPHVSGTEELQLVLIFTLCLSPRNQLAWQELILLAIIPLLPFVSPAIGPLSGNRMLLFIVKIFVTMFIAFSIKNLHKARQQTPRWTGIITYEALNGITFLRSAVRLDTIYQKHMAGKHACFVKKKLIV